MSYSPKRDNYKLANFINQKEESHPLQACGML